MKRRNCNLSLSHTLVDQPSEANTPNIYNVSHHELYRNTVDITAAPSGKDQYRGVPRRGTSAKGNSSLTVGRAYIDIEEDRDLLKTKINAVDTEYDAVSSISDSESVSHHRRNSYRSVEDSVPDNIEFQIQELIDKLDTFYLTESVDRRQRLAELETKQAELQVLCDRGISASHSHRADNMQFPADYSTLFQHRRSQYRTKKSTIISPDLSGFGVSPPKLAATPVDGYDQHHNLSVFTSQVTNNVFQNDHDSQRVMDAPPLVKANLSQLYSPSAQNPLYNATCVDHHRDSPQVPHVRHSSGIMPHSLDSTLSVCSSPLTAPLNSITTPHSNYHLPVQQSALVSPCQEPSNIDLRLVNDVLRRNNAIALAEKKRLQRKMEQLARNVVRLFKERNQLDSKVLLLEDTLAKVKLNYNHNEYTKPEYRNVDDNRNEYMKSVSSSINLSEEIDRRDRQYKKNISSLSATIRDLKVKHRCDKEKLAAQWAAAMDKVIKIRDNAASNSSSNSQSELNVITLPQYVDLQQKFIAVVEDRNTVVEDNRLLLREVESLQKKLNSVSNMTTVPRNMIP